MINTKTIPIELTFNELTLLRVMLPAVHDSTTQLFDRAVESGTVEEIIAHRNTRETIDAISEKINESERLLIRLIVQEERKNN